MMKEDKEEIEHLIDILKQTKEALSAKDALMLKDLSNQKIHSSCIYQHESEITLAVIIYALGKLIERIEGLNISESDWAKFVSRFNNEADRAITALEDNKEEDYEESIENARKIMESIAPDIKQSIREILRRASINKASRLYEHGISMGQTAKMLGISQWELSEYTGQTRIPDVRYGVTLEVKKRAKMALDFFGGTG